MADKINYNSLSLMIYQNLKNVDWENFQGTIKFQMFDLEFNLKTRDIVGVAIEAWIEVYFKKIWIQYAKPQNTQEFPDFYLIEQDQIAMLEVKTYNGLKTPAFDIGNFDTYQNSLKKIPESYMPII